MVKNSWLVMKGKICCKNICEVIVACQNDLELRFEGGTERIMGEVD